MDNGLVSKTGAQGDGLDDVDFPEDEQLDPTLNDDDDDNDGDDNIVDVDGSACEQFAASSEADGINGVDVKIHKWRGNLYVTESQTLDLTNIRGSVYAKTVDASHLRNIRGGLCLVGDSLDKLNNHRGNIEIIGAETTSINNTRGTMIINGGHVALISNHRGDIIFKNGATHGEIRNHKDGTVSELPAALAGI